MGVKVGIDLGTTFSAVSYINPVSGKAEIVNNLIGEPITPSVVAISEDGKVLHGVIAKEMREEGYVHTASFFKRSMGDPNFLLPLCGRNYSATELSSLLLQGFVRDAEAALGQKIDGAAITCPAYFRNREREATIEAGNKASINVLALLPEPTAAAFAYGLKQKSGQSNVLIYDLGGGTFDVTIAKIDEDEITILGSDGNHSLGGKDWDEAISRWIADKFEDEFGIDLLESEEQISIMTGVAENAKKRLTSTDVADISVYYKGKKGKYQLSVQEFNSITGYMLGETESIIIRLFDSIKVGSSAFSWSNIDGVILVGGSTRMRMVHDYVLRMTGSEPLSGVNVDEAVALGAAIRANQTSDGKPQMSLAGAFSAQVQRMIGGKKITDVTTHALGMISVSADGERYVTDILNDKNFPLPCEKTIRRQLRVSKKRENELEVYVLQGSDPSPLNCDITEKHTFTGIKYVENGQTVIDITYKYNENGIIEVNAKQADNNRELKVTKSFELGDMSWAGRSPKDNVGSIPIEGEIFLVADLSGSMEGSPLAEAKIAMSKFVDDADLECFKIGVIGVADSVKVYLKPTNDESKINASIRAMTIGDCGYCNAAHPFDVLLSAFSKDCELKYVVVLADGIWEKQKDAIQAAAKCHRNNIAVIGLGFGGADKDFMESISSEKDLAVITQMSGLTSSFSKIAQIIGSRGNSLTRG